MLFASRRAAALAATLTLPTVAFAAPALAIEDVDAAAPQLPSGTTVEFLDSFTAPNPLEYLGEPVGGISGLERVGDTDTYIGLSDDRSNLAPARFYTFTIPVTDDGITDSGVEITSRVQLQRADGSLYPETTTDPESIRLAPGGTTLVWSDERDTNRGFDPMIHEVNLDGSFVRDIAVLEQFLLEFDAEGNQTRGVRNNQGFESLTFSPDGATFSVVTESALAQDVVVSEDGTQDTSRSRLVTLDYDSGEQIAQYVYPLQDSTFGATEALQISDTDYLVVERNWIDGVNTIRVMLASTQGATDVSDVAALDGTETPMTTMLIADLVDSDVHPDNVETLTWGPTLSDGSRTLLMNSDNNFNWATQETVVHVLRVDDPLVEEAAAIRAGEIPVTAQIPSAGGDGSTGGDGGDNSGETPLPGALVMSVSDGGLRLDDPRHGGDRLRLSGVLPEVSVTDSRARSAGWAVTGQASDLSSGGATVRAGHLGWAPFIPSGEAVPGGAVPSVMSGGAGLAMPATLGMSAEQTTGTASLAADVALEVPVDTRAGSYEGAVTVSLFPQD